MTMSLGIAALAIAQSAIGEGEDKGAGNNRGVWLTRIRHETQTGRAGEAWCATFVSWCFRRAVFGPLPFDLSSGAKRLVKNIGRAGDFTDRPEPGAVICWHRGVMPWQGHVEIVASYELGHLVTIAGNKGPAPSKVKRYIYTGVEWRDRLYRIAVI